MVINLFCLIINSLVSCLYVLKLEIKIFFSGHHFKKRKLSLPDIQDSKYNVLIKIYYYLYNIVPTSQAELLYVLAGFKSAHRFLFLSIYYH